MSRIYYAIDLKGFHENQDGPITNTNIISINAKNLEDAKNHVKRHHGQAYSVLPKRYFDNKIIR
jgi:hypothetical protein